MSCLAALLLSLSTGLPGGLEVSFGPAVGSLDPSDDFYQERFKTPGLSLGGEVTLASPLPVDLFLGGAWFRKEGVRGWDGEIEAVLMWVFPVAVVSPVEGLSVFAGPGVSGCWGDYSGTDDFGGFMEASGGSVGYGFTAGSEISLSGPLTCRLQYRSVWMDLKTDNVTLDGQTSYIFPAAETDLGFKGFFLGLSVSLAGGGNSVWR
jgi:hypothetical protein